MVDFIFGVVIVALVVLLTTAFVIVNNNFNTWKNQCHDRHGHVVAATYDGNRVCLDEAGRLIPNE